MGRAALGLLLCATAASAQLQLEFLGRYETGEFLGSAAEISAYDAASRRLFVTNVAQHSVDVLDLSDPSAPSLLFSIDVSPLGAAANSVAVRQGLIAVAIEAHDKVLPGCVGFYGTEGQLRAVLPVGALPDMLTFTPDGQTVLVANEGEPSPDYVHDPEGSISLIDLRRGLSQARVRTADFHAFDDALLEPGIRIFGPGASVSQDLEPEFIAISDTSRRAWITLQENNALAELDVPGGRIVRLLGLGTKAHDAPGNGLDASDDDLTIDIRNWPVRGMYQPDTIRHARQGGLELLVMANEGDPRDWPGYSELVRVKHLALDATVFPDWAFMQSGLELGRLNVSLVGGDPDGDGWFEELYSFGGRSFSIRTADGALLYDSGDRLEQLVAQHLPAAFNADNESNGVDDRSDNRGPEPEGLAVGRVFGRLYAFVGLERVGGIVVFDLDRPSQPAFVTYVNSRDLSGDPESGTAGDLGPEGLLMIDAQDSPNGEPLLVVTNEVSGSTAIWALRAASPTAAPARR